MFTSLYARLAAVLMLVFCGIGLAMVLATERMLETRRLLEIATELIAGSIAFTLLAALIVFNLLTRRLRELSAAMDAFRAGNFSQPVRFACADARGDEIGRLGAAFQEMSERIASQLRQLEHNDEQRRELLANVSHDLRTPLASMQGYLETLLLKQGTLPAAEERNYLEVAARHSERLGRLIGDLFQLTKLEAREVEPRSEAFSLAELAQDVAQKYQLKAQRRGLRLETLLPELPQVSADIGMIERVLENLVENALRHTPAGGVIRIETGHAGDRALMRVSDTGHGIPADQLDNIFERYYKLNRGEAGDAGSTGLGLAITRRIVELHGGHIRADSVVGAGTVFTFDLPLAAAALKPSPVSA